MTLADVYRNLEFIEYVGRQELLNYSDGFPFKTLHVAPWSPIAARLSEQDVLDADGATCRFRDRRVGALAEFADRLHACMPAIFKQRIVGDSKEGLRMNDGASEPLLAELASGTARLRQWLGLTVVPRYIRSACSAVEKSPRDFHAELDALEAAFDEEMRVLRRLESRLEAILAEETDQVMVGTPTRCPGFDA